MVDGWTLAEPQRERLRSRLTVQVPVVTQGGHRLWGIPQLSDGSVRSDGAARSRWAANTVRAVGCVDGPLGTDEDLDDQP